MKCFSISQSQTEKNENSRKQKYQSICFNEVTIDILTQMKVKAFLIDFYFPDFLDF